MGDLLRDMETQKTLLDNQIQEMKKKQNDLEQLEIEMKKQQEKLERTQLTARKEEAAKFAEKLREKENVLEEILEKLKSDPSRKVVARSWDDIKYVKRDVLNEVESFASMMRRAPLSAAKDTSESIVNWVPISELRDKPNLNVGDPVYICKPGSFLGKLAKVISVGGSRVDVSVNGLAMSMKMNELAVSLSEDSRKDEGKVQAEDNKISKLARKALLDESLMGNEKGSGRKISPSSDVSGSNNEPSGSITVRLKTNTIDVLGCTFQDAKQKCEEKFSQVMSQKSPVVYILHGHGTQGVLKEKIRDWLQRDRQWVKKWKPADAADGGDAFTLVELKKLQV
jgi:dsDNA-specific endonuclease/ATPase MutS2